MSQEPKNPTNGAQRTPAWPALVASPVVLCGFVAYAFLAPATYRATARIQIQAQPKAAVALPSPAQATPKLQRLAVADESAALIAREISGDAAAARRLLDSQLALTSEGNDFFAVSVLDGDAARAQRICNLVARRVASHATVALASDLPKQAEPPARDARAELAAFLAAHPELKGPVVSPLPSAAPKPAVTAQVAALRAERKRIEAQLEGRLGAEDSDNPYGDLRKVDESTLRRRLEEIDLVIRRTTERPETPSATPKPSPEIEAEHRRLLAAASQPAAKPEVQTSPFLVRLAEASLPDSPVKPNRRLWLAIGALSALLSGAVALFAFRPRAPRKANDALAETQVDAWRGSGSEPPPRAGASPSRYSSSNPPPQYGSGAPPQQYGSSNPPPPRPSSNPPPQYGSSNPPPQYGSSNPPPQYGSSAPPQQYGSSNPPAPAQGAEAPRANGGSEAQDRRLSPEVTVNIEPPRKTTQIGFPGAPLVPSVIRTPPAAEQLPPAPAPDAAQEDASAGPGTERVVVTRSFTVPPPPPDDPADAEVVAPAKSPGSYSQTPEEPAPSTLVEPPRRIFEAIVERPGPRANQTLPGGMMVPDSLKEQDPAQPPRRRPGRTTQMLGSPIPPAARRTPTQGLGGEDAGAARPSREPSYRYVSTPPPERVPHRHLSTPPYYQQPSRSSVAPGNTASQAPEAERARRPAYPSTPRPAAERKSNPVPSERPKIITHKVHAAWSPAPAVRRKVHHELCDQLLPLALESCFVVGVTAPPDARSSKTTIACELALGLADAKHPRVLLVDADFQWPMVHEVMNVQLPMAAGFSQQLRGRVQGKTPSWIVMECTPTLHVIGEGVMRSPGLILSSHFEDALNSFRAYYDLVVVDGPLATPHADCRAFDYVIDGLVMVSPPGGSSDLAEAKALFSEKRLSTVLEL